MSTAAAPVQAPTTTPQPSGSIGHLYCCQPGWALCGHTNRHGPYKRATKADQTCAMCDHEARIFAVRLLRRYGDWALDRPYPEHHQSCPHHPDQET